jgi:uncharacterized protein (TIGR02391 family)
MTTADPLVLAATAAAYAIAGDTVDLGKVKKLFQAKLEQPAQAPLSPGAELLAEYDRRILDVDLRVATRSRFVSKHYADAVEAGVKTINEVIRKRTGRTEDGDELMTKVFHPNGALLRINKLRSKSDQSAQRGHMLLCQGVIGAWRNPRAHTLTDDSPARALMMLELIDDLLRTTKAATRTRKRKGP